MFEEPVGIDGGDWREMTKEEVMAYQKDLQNFFRCLL